jgi:hypothetical protein
MGVRWGANNSSPLKETAYYEMLDNSSDSVGPCEHGNETSGSIKGGKFLD